jgi:endonuclease/exonuclease/phosphatase family metal-dependent hydrolase
MVVATAANRVGMPASPCRAGFASEGGFLRRDNDHMSGGPVAANALTSCERSFRKLAESPKGDLPTDAHSHRFRGRRARLMADDRVAVHGPNLAAAMATAGSIKIVTYNIHACVGVDRQYDPARIAAVLRAIDADIACLQEVAARRRIGRDADQWAFLAEATGRQIILGADLRERRRRIGNAILTRFPVLAASTIDLSLPGLAPRSALDADLLVGDRVLRVVATHFGLSSLERRLQASRLLAVLGAPLTARRRNADAVLVMGDLNEWRGRAGVIVALDRRLGPSAAPRTFPSWMPMLPLDRIYVDGPAVLRELAADRSPLARLASDHLPLVGQLSWVGIEKRQHTRQPRRRRDAGSARPAVAATAPPA